MLRTPPPEEAFVLQARSCWTSIWNAGAVPVICAIQKHCCAADTESPMSPCETFDNGSSIFSCFVLLYKCSSRHQHSQETQRKGNNTRLTAPAPALLSPGQQHLCPFTLPHPCCRAGIPWGHQHPHGIVRHPGVPQQLGDDGLSLEPACICSSITSSRSLKP